VKTKPNFSKAVLAAVMACYLAAVIIGSIVVLKDTAQATFYFAFIAAPTATALGFYAWKAKAENVKKIEKGKPEGEQ
jgi:hypothetical protein